MFFCQWKNFSCNHVFFLSKNELLVQSWLVFVNEWTFRAIMTFLLFCVINKLTFCAIMTFCFVKEWTFRAIMAVFLSHDERFLLSWLVFVFFVNEITCRAIMFLFLLFCCGQTFTFSCNHDFVFFAFGQWMNCLCYHDISFCFVEEWTFCRVVTLLLSKNELFVQSWFCFVFVLVNEWTVRAIMTVLLCLQIVNFSRNHDFVFVNEWTCRTIMIFVFGQ